MKIIKDLNILKEAEMIELFCNGSFGLTTKKVWNPKYKCRAINSKLENFESYRAENTNLFRTVLKLKNCVFCGGVWNVYDDKKGFRLDFELLDYSFRGLRQNYHHLYNQSINNNAIKIEGRSLLLAGTWSNEYYHFCNETLPKVFLTEIILGIETIDHIILNKPQKRFIHDWFSIIDVDSKKIKYCDSRESFRCEELVVPYMLSDPGKSSEEFASFLTSKINTKIDAKLPSEYNKKLFISRRNNRVIKNEKSLIEKILQPYGFRTVYLEDYSVIEQLKLIRFSDIIIAPHGAGLVNLYAFNGKLIELVGESYNNTCYYNLAMVLEIQYSYLTCKEDNGDLIADIPKLYNYLKSDGLL